MFLKIISDVQVGSEALQVRIMHEKLDRAQKRGDTVAESDSVMPSVAEESGIIVRGLCIISNEGDILIILYRKKVIVLNFYAR